MGKLRLLTAVITITSVAYAGPGDVINYFTLQGLTEYGPRGLAYDPSADAYFVTTPINTNNVRVIKFTYDGLSPTVISTFACDDELYWPTDAAWEVNLAVGEAITDGSPARVVFVEDGTGDFVSAFDGPFGAGEYLNGLTWTGQSFFTAGFDSTTVYELTSAGVIINSFDLPSDGVKGLAWGAGYLWAVVADPYGGYYDYLVYKLTTTGTVIGTYPYDLGDPKPYVGGACWGRDDRESLLISTYSGNRYIYEVGFLEDAFVMPASVGRIKSVYK